MEEVNCYNVHEHTTYQVSRKNTVTVSWDTSNKQVHDLMIKYRNLYLKIVEDG